MFKKIFKKFMDQATKRIDTSYVIPKVPDDYKEIKIKQQFQEFVDYYGGINFNKVSFRPGAHFSSAFGLTERYKNIKNDKTGKYETVWGYPGIHAGYDRNGANKSKKVNDPIICPFNFGSSGYINHGPKKYTGTDIYLYHRFGFRMRIGHMFPKDIIPLTELMAGYAIKQNTMFGPAGKNGFSFGEHTHTEIESWGTNGEWIETCYLLDLILDKKIGKEARTPITNEEIIKIYKECPLSKDWGAKQVFEDYNAIIKNKNILFINKHKLVYKYKKKISTKYDTRSLFNM